MIVSEPPGIVKLIALTRPGNMAHLRQILGALPGRIGDERVLARVAHCACDVSVRRDMAEQARAYLSGIAGDAGIDWAIMSPENRRKKLLLCDMDSTLIGQESLDELAAIAGCKKAVVELTRKAMHEELDFAAAFAARLALLRGVTRQQLARTLARLRLNAGAAPMVATMRANGCRCILVSGGLDLFVAHFAARCGFDAWHGNRALFDGDHLAGTAREPILGAQSKRAVLRAEATRLGLGSDDAIAVGDGNNDCDMVEEAGLGIAYRGSARLKKLAHCRIDHTDLTSVLFFQGFTEDDIIHPADNNASDRSATRGLGSDAGTTFT